MSSKFIFCLFTFLSFSVFAMSFERACDSAPQTLVIGAVGDFLMHTPLQRSGNQNGYASLWKGVQYRINQVGEAGLMYGNLETPIAPGINKGQRSTRDPGNEFDNSVYSSYPIFNTPPALLKGIHESGFHIVSTANNHALDRGAVGADLTIKQLEIHKLPFTGTRTTGTDGSFSKILYKNGFSIGFIACTYSINGFEDRGSQILECYRERSLLLREIQELRSRVDAVIVTPHWGNEYQHLPANQEKKLAREMLEAGATAVIGTHPHVIQPNEKYRTLDGREGFIAYSTGNFIAAQGGIKRVGLMIFVGLSKSGGHTWINGVRYSPTYMVGMSQGVYFLDNTPAQGQFRPFVDRLMNDPHGLLDSRSPLLTNPECSNYSQKSALNASRTHD